MVWREASCLPEAQEGGVPRNLWRVHVVSIRFNADEIFQIAERMEQNAISFYLAAAAKVASPAAARTLRDLSAWEAQHERIFAAMRAELAAAAKEPLIFDPNDENVQYLEALADHSVFILSNDPLLPLGNAPPPDRILRVALDLEKDSVLFYSQIRELVPAKFGQDRVEQIVREEMQHITILNTQLRALAS